MTEQKPHQSPADFRGENTPRSPADPAVASLEAERERLDWLENQQPASWRVRLQHIFLFVVLLICTAGLVGLLVMVLR